VKFSFVLWVVFSCQLLGASNSLLLPSLFQGSPLFSNINFAQQSKKPFRFQLLYENRFLLKDVSPKSICLEKSFAKHQWSISFFDWGSKYYKERIGRLNYSMQISSRMSVGINAAVQTKKRFKSKLSVQLLPALGIQYKILENSKFFSSFQLGKTELLIFKAYLGFSHEFAPSYQVYGLIKFSEEEKAFLSVGVRHERESGNEFVLQLNSKNYPLSIAYQLVWRQFSFRMSMYYHFQLGMSNHVGLGYQSME
jgi:hypothetical protein